MADAGGGAGPDVTVSLDGPVATLTLARPERRNVLTAAAMAALRDHVRTLGDDPGVRVIVLTGTGSTFCAGADLRDASSGESRSFAGSGASALAELLAAMLDCPTPIIARVQGHVAGGGNGLIAAADLAVAADSAMFAFSEVRLGVVPAVIGVVCLARMHPAAARELLLTGDRVPAAGMLQAGLLNRVAAGDELDAVVATWVDALLRGGPGAIAETKALLRDLPALDRAAAFTHAAEVSARRFASDEARAGMVAFLGRRPAPWVPPDLG